MGIAHLKCFSCGHIYYATRENFDPETKKYTCPKCGSTKCITNIEC